MKRSFHQILWTPVLLCIAVIFWFGACDSGAQPSRHQGGAGYGCFFDADCLEPLVCETTPSAQFPVCTGLMLEGEPCEVAYDCAWIRDELGLPLSCLPDGVCGFVQKDDGD